MNIAIFGAGNIGLACVRRINALIKEKAHFFLIDEQNTADKYARLREDGIHNVSRLHANMSKSDGAKYIEKALLEKEIDICIGALPSDMQYIGALIALHCGAHYFDLGASQAELMKQKAIGESFKANKKILMPFCGFDPGLLNILLLSCVRHIDCDEIKVYVGSIPKKCPRSDVAHEWTFSPASTLETYKGDVLAIENGILTKIKSLEGYEKIQMCGTDNGAFYGAFFTDCGNKPLFELIAETQKIKTCHIRTMRYPGHHTHILGHKEGKICSPCEETQWAKKDIAHLNIVLKLNNKEVGNIAWTENADEKEMAITKATAGGIALTMKWVLEFLKNGNNEVEASGFSLPETFVCNTLKGIPQGIIDSMKEYGFKITDSLPRVATLSQK